MLRSRGIRRRDQTPAQIRLTIQQRTRVAASPATTVAMLPGRKLLNFSQSVDRQ
jgi:hypothetical protein